MPCRREKEEWRKRVVVDDVNFHSVIPSRAVVTDLDRNRPWLVDKPRKIGLRVAPRLEKTPINAQLAVPWNQGGKDVLLRKPIPEKWVDGDFMR